MTTEPKRYVCECGYVNPELVFTTGPLTKKGTETKWCSACHPLMMGKIES